MGAKMNDVIEEIARRAYNTINGLDPNQDVAWQLEQEATRQLWREMTKEIYTEGIAAGAMDSELTEEFLNGS